VKLEQEKLEQEKLDKFGKKFRRKLKLVKKCKKIDKFGKMRDKFKKKRNPLYPF
jgi:hypothetical protein